VRSRYENVCSYCVNRLCVSYVVLLTNCQTRIDIGKELNAGFVYLTIP